MQGVQNPRVRPHRVPGGRSTFGRLQPMLPSRSYGAMGAQESGESDATRWTPNGVFAAISRVHRPLPYGLPSVSPPARFPGGFYYTPPALWNLTSMSDGFLYPVLPRKRGTTSYAPRVALNPFPSFAPPLPSYPAPAAWPGRL